VLSIIVHHLVPLMIILSLSTCNSPVQRRTLVLQQIFCFHLGNTNTHDGRHGWKNWTGSEYVNPLTSTVTIWVQL